MHFKAFQRIDHGSAGFLGVSNSSGVFMRLQKNCQMFYLGHSEELQQILVCFSGGFREAKAVSWGFMDFQRSFRGFKEASGEFRKSLRMCQGICFREISILFRMLHVASVEFRRVSEEFVGSL